MRYKSQRRYDTVAFVHGSGGKIDLETKKVYLQGVGQVKLYLHRPLRGEITQFTVTRKGKKWYVNVSCKNVPRQIQPLKGRVIGLDQGVTHLLADSGGGFYENPKLGEKYGKQLAAAQRVLSRTVKGSKRRRKAVAEVRRIYEKIGNARRDHHHKLSRRLVDENDTIILEDLNISNMVRSAKGTLENPGVNVAQKKGLSKSILDASWGVLTDMIVYKAEEAGVKVVFVNPCNTSRRCNACGYTAEENRVREDFRCLECGHTDHADTNAAKNVYGLGLAPVERQPLRVV